MKKNFLPAFTPARLVQGKARWYIIFNASSEKSNLLERYRPTFSLNRIKCLHTRLKRGEELTQKINWWLEKGYEPWLFDEKKVPFNFLQAGTVKKSIFQQTNVIEALEYIKEVKSKGLARHTARSYRSHTNILIRFLQKKKYASIAINDFSKNLAMQFLDYRLTADNVSHTTYNNIITNLRVIFYALVEREYLEQNPFSKIKKKKPSEKIRRPFSDGEAAIMIDEIRKESKILFYALLLEYTCFIRPAEIRGLRFADIDLKSGVVSIRNHTKKKESRFATIPTDFLAFFDEKFFIKYPAHYLIFGNLLRPHATKPCGDHTFNNKHKKILHRLLKSGILKDITGLQFYSWKDTGITYALEKMKILAVQDQAGHSTPSMTLKYRKKPKENEEIREGFTNKLIR